MNDLTKNFFDIRDSDPVTALRKFVAFDFQQYEKRVATCLSTRGKLTPKMTLKMNNLHGASSDFSVTLGGSSRNATVQVPVIRDDDAFIATYQTKILYMADDDTGMKVECSCLCHKHGILCDHAFRHIQEVGGYDVADFVHERDTSNFYTKQYPLFGLNSLSFKLPVYDNIKPTHDIYLPTVTCVRRGRPRKGRYVGEREKKIKKFFAKPKTSHKKKAVKTTL